MGYCSVFRMNAGKVICFFAMVTVLCLFVPSSVNCAPGVTLKEKFGSKSFARASGYQYENAETQELYYASLKDGYKQKGYIPAKDNQIVLDPSSIKNSSKGDIPIYSDIGKRSGPALDWEAGYEWFDWTFDVSVPGLYEIVMEYYPLPGTGSSIQRELLIDGKIPFAEAHTIAFERMWKDAEGVKFNNIGNEVRPSQKEVSGWRTVSLSDNQGTYPEPFLFYFSKGEHTVRMNYVDQPAAFGRITIRPPETLQDYEKIKEQYESKSYLNTTKIIKFQAESNVVQKTDPTIRRESDPDPMTEPVTLGSRKLNMVGGWPWRKGNQSITWEFDVPEDGLYNIGMRLNQSYNDGLPVYRQILIDDKIPFTEMNEYPFKYNRDWRMEVLQDPQGEPYLFYLAKGRHRLTMTVKMGLISDIISSLNNDALLLSDLIRNIIMITGNQPDIYYNYYLDEKIPGLLDNFKKLAGSLQKKADKMIELSTKRPVMVDNFRLIIDQLSKMIKNPESISNKLNDLQNAQNSIGSAIMSLKDQPLAIDYFMVGTEKENWHNVKSNVFQRIYTTLYNFIYSFTVDYDRIGSVSGKGNKTGAVLNIWIARGKEWGEIIKELIDEDFTPKTNVAVNMNILPASQLNAGSVNALMLAISSGKAPDMACGVAAGSPVEFAIRDIPVNLRQFSDYDEIASRFLPNILIPFEYMKGIYALPETMNFKAIFYRKDIISELGISIPDTWEDLYQNVLPVLYQNNMECYIPPNDLTPFLFQRGGNFYNKDGTKTGLDTPEAYLAFKELTDLNTSYGIPVSANFFNRMRSGEMPIGIGDYNMYITLSVSAPELYGRWGIAPLPGTKKGDGVTDRTIGGIANDAIIILKNTKYKNEAWEFLKWWTSTDVQVRFGKELEALMGVEARWNTANTEAFSNLPWNKKDLKIIQENWKWYKETPVVLGGYFTGRHITNAWNRVVISGMPLRDSLEKAVDDINRELRSKQEEYGFINK